jgi:hypothetical protein
MQKAVNLIDAMGEIDVAIQSALSIKERLEQEIEEMQNDGTSREQIRQTREDKYSTTLYLWKLIKCKKQNEEKRDKEVEN